MRIAVVGSGSSGIAWASVLQREGHEVVIFEASGQLGGVWTRTYPGVQLQNLWTHYHISDFPWPFRPQEHPTAEEILRYLEAAVRHFDLDVRLNHRVLALEELDSGWRVRLAVDGRQENAVEEYDFVVVAVGQYTQPSTTIDLPGSERFTGAIISERDVHDLDKLGKKRLVVVGYGKSAVDLAAFAAARGSHVEHVFRTPRWLLPLHLGGLVHYTFAIFNRVNSVMIPCWAQPSAGERFLHERLSFVVRGFWAAISGLLRVQLMSASVGSGAAGRSRLRKLLPSHTLISDMRSAAAVAPTGYYRAVARGEITPHRATVVGMSEGGVLLDDGRELPCDTLLLCLGASSPRFPFMPERYRALLESEPDGVQLYRHILHPRIPRLAFAGFNHGFLHVPAAEVGALWMNAVLRGDLELPSVEAMEAAIAHIRGWKRQHINFEPSRSCAINTRFHQYLDILLHELGLNHRRKSNPLAELLVRYEAADYAGLIDEYRAARAAAGGPRKVLDVAT
ncbi:MAG: NAD(P)/FAD-dependent oxidoreductase [Myxococcales bacterium]|nr:NAD(P)/FAD-dependent oxidoreductase [Myxococcales bacterium]